MKTGEDQHEIPSTENVVEDVTTFRFRRIHYLLVSIVIMGIQFCAANGVAGLEPATLRTPLGWLTALGFVVAAFLRLKNIGGTPWIAPLALIPIAQYYIWLRCFSYQEDFKSTGKLDTAGKWIFWILLSLFAILILATLAT